jgi:hypothetical protein
MNVVMEDCVGMEILSYSIKKKEVGFCIKE